MKSKIHEKLSAEVVASTGLAVVLAMAGYGIYQYRTLYHKSDSELNLAKEDNLALVGELKEVSQERLDLLELSSYQQSIINSFQGQISSIGQTVGTLEKLARTDKELLKKYSKVYFLNENYVPAKLTQVEEMYVFDGGGDNFLVHAEIWPHLKRLLETAREEGIELLIISAFRSYDTQASLKFEYKVIYGAGTANQFSADQGYSEHQLGTSVDFTTSAVGGALSEFKSDPAFEWLIDNAYKYGFTLSYPEGNVYYKFEPWHWRFVSVTLATDLHEAGKYFYDLDQREIDTYLIKLFDI